MNQIRWAALASVLISMIGALAMGQSATPSGTSVSLAKGGKALLPIFSAAQEPATELQSYLKRITGADFEIRGLEGAAKNPGSAGIYVGLASEFPGLKLDKVGSLGDEGFILRSDGKSVYLIADKPLGVQRAVTTALQKMGCRWFFPGQTWEVIPSTPELSVAFDEVQKPSFTTQRTVFIGFGTYPRQGKEMDEWNRHNRMGGPIKVNIGHTWYGLDPDADIKTHPEWFALVHPKPTTQGNVTGPAQDAAEMAMAGQSAGQRKNSKPCYSNPEVLKKATEYALAAAKRDGGHGMVSFSPPDGLGFCECNLCMSVLQGGVVDLALTKEYSTMFGTRPDGILVNVVSETLFAFINKVAEAVSKEYPDYIIGSYAYSGYSHPASFKLHPNVYVQTTTRFRRTPLTLEDQLSQWGSKAKKVDIRGYWSVYQWDWDGPDVGLDKRNDPMVPDQMQKELQNYLKWNVTGLNSEACYAWGPRGLAFYMGSQLLWDVNTDVKAAVKDFYDQAFGPAAGAMERYYVRWYGPGAAITGPGSEPQKLDPNTLKAAFKDLDEAAALVKDKPAYLARVNDLRMYAHYLLLRQHVRALAGTKDQDKAIAAIKAETVFGARLTDTGMIHSRPLLGKAFLRRFNEDGLKDYIADKKQEGGKLVDEPKAFTADWLKVGTPPARDELEKLWAQDKAELQLN